MEKVFLLLKNNKSLLFLLFVLIVWDQNTSHKFKIAQQQQCEVFNSETISRLDIFGII